MNKSRVNNTERAIIVSEYLVRVQISTDNVTSVLNAISKVSPLKYGRYEQVVFRVNAGTQRFKPIKGSKTGIQISADL